MLHHPHPIRISLWFGVLAIIVTLLVGGVWTGLLLTNLAVSPFFPWSVAAMALILATLWWYLNGAGWPRATRILRQQAIRAHAVPFPLMLWALFAGGLGIVALAGLWIVLFHLAHLPLGRNLPNYAQYPVVTVALALIMASLTNGVIEEALFRGYFQGAVERVLAAPLAIVLVAIVMAPEHALTQGFVWPTLAFYFCVDLLLGTLAFFTKSIIPGMIVHSIGLLIFFTLVWPGDKAQQLLGNGSADLWFWIHLGQALIFGLLTVIILLQLRKSAQTAFTSQFEMRKGK